MTAWLKNASTVQRVGILLMITAAVTVVGGAIDEYGGLPLGRSSGMCFKISTPTSVQN